MDHKFHFDLNDHFLPLFYFLKKHHSSRCSAHRPKDLIAVNLRISAQSLLLLLSASDTAPPVSLPTLGFCGGAFQRKAKEGGLLPCGLDDSSWGSLWRTHGKVVTVVNLESMSKAAARAARRSFCLCRSLMACPWVCLRRFWACVPRGHNRIQGHNLPGLGAA